MTIQFTVEEVGEATALFRLCLPRIERLGAEGAALIVKASSRCDNYEVSRDRSEKRQDLPNGDRRNDLASLGMNSPPRRTIPEPFKVKIDHRREI